MAILLNEVLKHPVSYQLNHYPIPRVSKMMAGSSAITSGSKMKGRDDRKGAECFKEDS